MDELRLFADYHTHTGYRNPRIKVEAHIRAAQRAGLREVGITDHGPNTVGTRALAASIRLSLGKVGSLKLLEEVRDAVFEIRRRGMFFTTDSRNPTGGHGTAGGRDMPEDGDTAGSRGTVPDHSVTAGNEDSTAPAPDPRPRGQRKAQEEQEEEDETERDLRAAIPLAGVEANVMGSDGELDVPPPVLNSLDITLAGLHRWVVPHSIRESLHLGPLGAALARTSLYRHEARVINTKAMVEAVMRNRIDIVTHPGLGFDIDTLELARACAKRGTAMEINSSHSSMTVDYVRIAAKAGATFVISSDAHSPKDVGNLERGLTLAKRARLSPDQIINAVDPEGGEKGLLAKTRKRKAKSWA